MSRHGYEPAVLSGRKVYWCPSYEGHLAFCPQPTDPDTHIFCCKSFYLGHTEKPSCCMYALLCFNFKLYYSFIDKTNFLVSIFFACWCLPCCPLNKKIAENQDINEENEIRMKSY